MNKGNKPKFAVFDIDGTLIRWQLYHAIADNLVKLGYASTEDYQVVKDARLKWKMRTDKEAFKTYEQKLVKAYEKVLTRLTFDQFEQAANGVFNEYKDQVYAFTRDLILQLKAENYLIFAISGSQIEIVKKVIDYYGFDDCVGSVYERNKQGFAGKVTAARHDKHLILKALVSKYRATYKDSVAVGDSEGDITMLEAVEKPIAFNPTHGLFVYAKRQKWPIVVERKNVIYKLGSSDGTYILA